MKSLSALLLGLFWLCLAVPQALADDTWPTRQIKIIVPFPGGAGPDQVARLIGKHLQDALSQPVVIENRAGALGSIGAAEVSHAPPDGYTLLMGTNTTQASNVATLKNPGYDPARDFAPIIRTTTTAMVLLVKPDFPAKDLPQFLAYARAHKNLTGGYGSGASQISVAQLQSRGGVSLVAASYRGVPLAMTDVMAGVIDLTFGDFSVAIPQMQGGTLRGIGVTSAKRNDLLPELPALAEAMPGFEFDHLVRAARAGRYAGGDRQQNPRRDREIPHPAGDEEAARRCRRYRCDPDAGRVRQLHQERDRALGRGLPGCRYRAAIDHGTSSSRRRHRAGPAGLGAGSTFDQMRYPRERFRCRFRTAGSVDGPRR